MPSRANPPKTPQTESRDAKRGWFRPEHLIAVVSIAASAAVAVLSTLQTGSLNDKQYRQDLVKADRSELRTTLDATTGTAATLTLEFANFARDWTAKKDVPATSVEEDLDKSTAVAARLAVRLDDHSALPVAYQVLNHHFIVIRDVIAGKRTGDAAQKLLAAQVDLPDALNAVWQAAFALGRSELSP